MVYLDHTRAPVNIKDDTGGRKCAAEMTSSNEDPPCHRIDLSIRSKDDCHHFFYNYYGVIRDVIIIEIISP